VNNNDFSVNAVFYSAGFVFIGLAAAAAGVAALKLVSTLVVNNIGKAK